jgi:hypothetical protein
MATLQAIGYNFLAGGCCMVVGFSSFGLAIRFGYNDMIAPRTWARPSKVIRNVFRSKNGGDEFPCGAFAYRWIPWALSLSYQDMLDGIKGTGTRQNGHTGKLLKCNLDGIVLVRYHALCLRVSILATILCLCIVLPLNITAGCNEQELDIGLCNATLTNFEITTMAHIPSVERAEGDEYRLFFGLKFAHVLGRLYAIVFVAWALYIYTCGM